MRSQIACAAVAGELGNEAKNEQRVRIFKEIKS